jgi:phosphoserine phosphatase RsbX
MEELKVARVEWWAASRTRHGQTTCGDRYLVRDASFGSLLAVVDGIGHGQEAAAAAEIALRTLEQHGEEPAVIQVNRCHAALRGTRGVVMNLAHFRARERTLTWLGVGNVEGLVLSHDHGKPLKAMRLLQRSGVLGSNLPALQSSTFPVAAGDTLLFATDGIATGFDRNLDLRQGPQALAEGILARHARGTDDALVLVARFVAG